MILGVMGTGTEKQGLKMNKRDKLLFFLSICKGMHWKHELCNLAILYNITVHLTIPYFTVQKKQKMK